MCFGPVDKSCPPCVHRCPSTLCGTPEPWCPSPSCPSQSDCIFCPSRRSMDTIAHWKNPCFGPVDKSCPPWSILVPEPWCPLPGLSISIRLYLLSIQEVHGHDCSLEELRHPCVLVRWTSLVHPVSIVVHPNCVLSQNLGVHRQACPSQSDCIFCPSRRSMDTIAHLRN